RTLEQYLDRIDRTIQEEKRFSAEVSHELRTPVTAIKGALDVIHRRGAEQAGDMARPLARIDRAVLDMESLIETFLTLSRIRGHLPEKEIIEVRPFIQDIVGQNAYLLRKKSVMVDIRADDALTINQSPMVFKIAISNLIRNAFQYTRQGDIHIIADDSMIRVSDTGEGFSVDTGLSDNNYSPAVQTSSEGFGIGLSIVQRLCGRAGWQLNVTSKKGHGTCVDLKHTR
ncbi:MAG: HAMP domain-containing histidine kinase, partial [Desulfobacterales bacterium]|nr:HAMP domain-containing histidine kinase [Desulfobacterales bacterium]